MLLPAHLFKLQSNNPRQGWQIYTTNEHEELKMARSKILQLAAMSAAFMSVGQAASVASEYVDRAAGPMATAWGVSDKYKTGHRDARPRSQQKKRIHARQQGHAKRRGCRL